MKRAAVIAGTTLACLGAAAFGAAFLLGYAGQVMGIAP